MDKNIRKVNDIVSQNNILSMNALREKYNLTYFEKIEMFSTIKTINQTTKSLIQEHSGTRYEEAGNYIRGKTSKDIGTLLLEKKSERASSELFFENLFEIGKEDWKNIYNVPFFSTIESKIRAFQFKINHNIFYHNKKTLRQKYD